MPAVTVLTDQEDSWVRQVAQRLRLLQADVADATAAERRSFLQEEIKRQLEPVPARERKRYLEALLSHFPVAGRVGAMAGSAGGPSSAATPAPAAPPQTPEQLLTSFLARVGELSEERKAALTKKLGEAGFVTVDRDALVLEVPEEYRQALGLPAGQQPQLTRLVQLTLSLLDLIYRVDTIALKSLSELAPRSPLLNRPRDFREAIASYLSGSSDSVEPNLKAVSSLLGGMLASVLAAGKDFGRQYVERFSPSAIEDVVKGEGKVKWWVPGSPTEKELCWDKYRDLAKDFATADLVDRRIRDCIGTFLERKVPAGR